MKHTANPQRVLEGKLSNVARRHREQRGATGAGPLAGPIYIGSPEPKSCDTCNRDPRKMNSDMAECSHLECPHRPRAWSSGTGPREWKPTKSADPLSPLFDKTEV